MLEHCNRLFRASEIWFLHSNKSFTNRKLEIGYCPECYNQICRLTEKRITDGQYFHTLFTRSKAQKIMNECKDDIEYTSLDIISIKGAPFGFKYGENKELVNKKTGVRVKIEKACDFYGNKEIIRTTIIE